MPNATAAPQILQFTLSIWQVLILLLILPTIQLSRWFWRTGKRVPDMMRLKFRKAHVLKVTLMTRAGRGVIRYVIPKGRGDFRIDGRLYTYARELTYIDPEHNIPALVVVEDQISPQTPELKVVERSSEVIVVGPEGEKTESRMVPTYVLDYRSSSARKVDNFTGAEIRELLDCGIAREVVRATLQDEDLGKVTLYVCLGVAVLVAIVGVVLWQSIHGEQTHLNEISAQLARIIPPTPSTHQVG